MLKVKNDKMLKITEMTWIYLQLVNVTYVSETNAFDGMSSCLVNRDACEQVKIEDKKMIKFSFF